MRSEVAPLPSWLTDPAPIEADPQLEKVEEEVVIKAAEEGEDFKQEYADFGRKSPLANPAVWEDFKKCRDVDALYSWAAGYGIDVREYPKLLFSRLCHAGQPLSVLLHALENPTLGTPRNLNFLLNWQLRERRGNGRLRKRLQTDDMAFLQKWMSRQMYLGTKSDEDILVFLRFISRVGDATSDESLKSSLITSLQSLQSSPMFGFKDLGTEAQCRVLELIAQGPVTSQLLEFGFSLIETMSHIQEQDTDRTIAAFIARVVRSHASRREHGERKTWSLEVMPMILETIGELPKKLASSVIVSTTKALFRDYHQVPAIKFATRQLLDSWFSALVEKRAGEDWILMVEIEDFLGRQKPQVVVRYLKQLDEREKARFMLRYWVGLRSPAVQSRAQDLFDEYCEAKRKESPWVSMLQAARQCSRESLRPIRVHVRRVFEALRMLHQSEDIVEILKQATKLKAVINEHDVAYIIRKHLGHQPYLAERMFYFYPGLRLERCPELAEQIIGNRRYHSATALRYMQRYTSRERISQPRIELLGRMAFAYSMATNITPRTAQRRVYECYTEHMKEQLGPLSIATARASTRTGIIQPLQAGRWGNTRTFEWILSIIRSTEGDDVADRVDEMMYRWRGTNLRYLE